MTLNACDAIMSHPALTPAAKRLIQDGIRETQAIRPDVDRFLQGFRLASPERAAVKQMTDAMFMAFSIRDIGGFVRVAIEVKRAQLCLLSVGVESSGVIEDIKSVVFQDDAGKRMWEQLDAYIESDDMPKVEGLICNP